MKRVAFTKYEGLGNDFLVVETENAELFRPDEVVAICDRRRGVGGDGILLILPGTDNHHARMRVLNADGSIPEMCGNGIRCAAAHLAQGDLDTLLFATDAGDRTCVVERTAQETRVAVEMGNAKALGRRDLVVEGFGATKVADMSMGNPHAILIDEHGKFVDVEAKELVGREIERVTPGGTNVEFAKVREDGSIDLVVFERGVGFTLACGTGACATAAYAAQAGIVPFGKIPVHLPGGTLLITVYENARVTMQGPARRVFSGVI